MPIVWQSKSKRCKNASNQPNQPAHQHTMKINIPLDFSRRIISMTAGQLAAEHTEISAELRRQLPVQNGVYHYPADTVIGRYCASLARALTAIEQRCPSLRSGLPLRRIMAIAGHREGLIAIATRGIVPWGCQVSATSARIPAEVMAKARQTGRMPKGFFRRETLYAAAATA